jgi:hypothetical protein
MIPSASGYSSLRVFLVGSQDIDSRAPRNSSVRHTADIRARRPNTPIPLCSRRNTTGGLARSRELRGKESVRIRRDRGRSDEREASQRRVRHARADEAREREPAIGALPQIPSEGGSGPRTFGKGEETSVIARIPMPHWGALIFSRAAPGIRGRGRHRPAPATRSTRLRGRLACSRRACGTPRRGGSRRS